jgi:hypothetical protein
MKPEARQALRKMPVTGGFVGYISTYYGLLPGQYRVEFVGHEAARSTDDMIGNYSPASTARAALGAILLLSMTATANAASPPATEPGGATTGYVVRGIRGGSEVELFGEIHLGSAQDLRDVLTRNPNAKVLHLNSPGGAIDEARDMAAIVRARGMITTIDRGCMSACTLVFLAGKERVLATGAELGFHRSTALDMDAAEVDAIQEPDRRFMLSMGIPAAFVDHVYSTPSSTIWIPTAVQLKVANAITEVSDRYRLSVDKIEPGESDDFDGMNRIIAALKKVDPARYNQLHEHLFQQMKTGTSQAEISAAMDAELTELFTRFISHAGDEVVSDYVRIFHGTLVKLQARDADACYFTLYPEYAPSGFNSQRVLSRADGKLVSNAILKAALDGAARNAPLPSADQIAEANDALARVLPAQHPEDMKAFEQAEKPGADHASVCKADVDMFAAMLTLPEHHQGALLRHLFAGGSAEATTVGSLAPVWPSRLHPDK